MTQETRVLAERYALEEQVARGGMATVWRARDEVLARTVAVKILRPHLSEDEAFLERFRREALAAARLSHPNIVAIYDTGEERGPEDQPWHFIVMEFCGGGTLADVLARNGRMAPGRVVAVGAGIAEALAYAHDNGVVHRDVKPANILLADGGNLKVADFGIAKAAFAEHDLTTTGSLLGTAIYLSPEQARGEEPDARSDLYQLGLVLYELLVGRPPFTAETAVATAMKHVNEVPAPPRSLRADVPRRLDAIVMRALMKDPDARFESAGQFRRALVDGSDPGATSIMPAVGPVREDAAPTARAAPPGGSDLRWIGLVVLFIAGAIALVAAVVWLATPDETRGPSSSRDSPRSGSSIEVAAVADFDPAGDGSEHPDEAGLASDGAEGTYWTTEGYSSGLQDLKPGVGLVFDLGSAVEVGQLEMVTPTPGLDVEIRAANEVGSEPEDFETAQALSAIDSVERFDFEPITARYWLVWITDLPGGGPGRAGIAEVRFFGG